MRNPSLLQVSFTSIAVAALTLTAVAPKPAHAGKRGVGAAIAIGAAAVIIGGALNASQSKKTRRKKSNRRRSGSRRSGRNIDAVSTDDNVSAAELIQATESFERDRATNRRRRANERSERNRNLKIEIKAFIGRLIREHAGLREKCGRNGCSRVRAGNKIKEITEGQIAIAVERAYQANNLRELSFSGDLWSPDALKVRILREAQQDIASFFEGVGVQGIGSDQMSELLNKSAGTVYQQALEMGEVVSVTESFNRFIRTLYETTPPNASNVETIGSDAAYHQMLRTYIDGLIASKLKGQGRARLELEKEFQLRFRLRRVLYDCLGGIYGEEARTSSARVYRASGAGVSAPSSFDNARPAEAVSPDNETLFQRVQNKLPVDCGGPLRKINEEVSSGGLRPRPARWNAWGEVDHRGQARQMPAAMPSVRSNLNAIFNKQ